MNPVASAQLATGLVLLVCAIFCGFLPLLLARDVCSLFRCCRRNKSDSALPGERRRESKDAKSSGTSQGPQYEVIPDNSLDAQARREAAREVKIRTLDRLVIREKILAALTCFGGGSLFATCFLHLVPEVNESLTPNSTKLAIPQFNTSSGDVQSEDDQFPLSELLICLGFFVIYLVEEAAHGFYDSCQNRNHVHYNVKKFKEKKSGQGFQSTSSTGEEHANIVCTADNRSRIPDYGAFESREDGANSSSSTINLIDSASVNVFAINELPLMNAIIIIIALSVHSIFEGMAIGVQDTSSHVWQLGLSIGIHKLIIAFVVGLELFTASTAIVKNFILLLVFALMTPVGILFAAVASFQAEENMVGILTALATGSLLYVTFFEILQKERQARKIPGFVQLLATLAGFSAMALIQYTAGHD